MRRSRAQLAHLIRERREHLRHSAAYVARNCNVSGKTYGGWERGERSIQAEYLPILSKLLCVPIRELADALIDRALFTAAEQRAAA